MDPATLLAVIVGLVILINGHLDRQHDYRMVEAWDKANNHPHILPPPPIEPTIPLEESLSNTD
jgi:hypothetical protein